MGKIKDAFFTDKEAEVFAELFGDPEYIEWREKLNEQSTDEQENRFGATEGTIPF